MDYWPGNRYVAWGVLLVFSFTLVSCGSPPTRKEIWNQYRQNYLNFQKDLDRAAGRKWPDLRPVFRAQYKYEKANMKWRTMKFDHLLNYDPDRIYTKGSIHEFIHFPWDGADTRRLLDQNAGAGKLFERVKRLKKKHFDHPKWSEARRKMRSLPRDSNISRLQQRFQGDLSYLDTWLKRYRQSHRTEDGRK